ncbi:MAG TPA: hypothetical protein VMD76_07750 [Candidatus Sulfotelmatobacter sp.]|nr:hypothetical protein [Candidatus Sulfotelmatobacter sp.]
MRKLSQFIWLFTLLSAPAMAQSKRLWVLRAPGEMVEYDSATFAVKQTVKVPAEAVKSPGRIAVNQAGQILYAPAVSLPLSDEDIASAHKIWIWNGHAATSLDQGVQHKVEETGSNHAVTESAPMVNLSADGAHLFWFATEARRLEREGIDLSLSGNWRAWRTDLTGEGREEIASTKIPECRCTTGTCEETCPEIAMWAPAEGLGDFFLMLQTISGQVTTTYKPSTLYQKQAGKWTAAAMSESLQSVLDAAADGTVIVEAIPDTGCCGWSNESDDQTLVLAGAKKLTVFDERAAYKNPDYDVSFHTLDARLSPELGMVAMTITATATPDKPIQLADEGQANPEESAAIRKALAELPAVSVKSIDVKSGDVINPNYAPKQAAFVPRASLVGWISEKELLIVEDHLLVVYNVNTGVRRKTGVKVEDAAHVFLR